MLEICRTMGLAPAVWLMHHHAGTLPGHGWTASHLLEDGMLRMRCVAALVQPYHWQTPAPTAVHELWSGCHARAPVPAGRAEALGVAFSLVAAVRERVWFCTVRGARPWERPSRADVRERAQGGHTIWYDEPALLEVRPPCPPLCAAACAWCCKLEGPAVPLRACSLRLEWVAGPSGKHLHHASRALCCTTRLLHHTGRVWILPACSCGIPAMQCCVAPSRDCPSHPSPYTCTLTCRQPAAQRRPRGRPLPLKAARARQDIEERLKQPIPCAGADLSLPPSVRRSGTSAPAYGAQRDAGAAQVCQRPAWPGALCTATIVPDPVERSAALAWQRHPTSCRHCVGTKRPYRASMQPYAFPHQHVACVALLPRNHVRLSCAAGMARLCTHAAGASRTTCLPVIPFPWLLECFNKPLRP